MSIPTDHSGDPAGAASQQANDRAWVRRQLAAAIGSLSPDQQRGLIGRIGACRPALMTAAAQAVSAQTQDPSLPPKPSTAPPRPPAHEARTQAVPLSDEDLVASVAASASPVVGQALREATRVPRRQPGAKGSQANPGMYRAEAGEVKRSGSSWFEIPTTYAPAQSASHGDYVISEVGAGAKPLVLVGTRAEIEGWLAGNSSAGICNVLPDFDGKNQNPTDIEMKVSRSRGWKPVTAESVRSLNPVEDASQSVAEFVVGMAGSGIAAEFGGGGLKADLADLGSAIADAIDASDSGTGDRPSVGEPVYNVEFFLAVPGGIKVASREDHLFERAVEGGPRRRETRISFGELAPIVASELG